MQLQGTVLLDGKDIRSYQPEERTQQNWVYPSGTIFIYRNSARPTFSTEIQNTKNLSNDELGCRD